MRVDPEVSGRAAYEAWVKSRDMQDGEPSWVQLTEDNRQAWSAAAVAAQALLRSPPGPFPVAP